MALFDGYYAPRQFGEGGGLLGRLLALQAQQDHYQPATGFAASAPTPQATQQIAWSNPPVDGLPSVEQAGAPNLNSQYRALRSVLGDHKAMLATVNPESRRALVAQALAGQQGFHNGDNGGGAPVVSDAFPDPVRPGSQYAGRADVARVGIKAGKALFDAIAAALAGKIILDNKKAERPGSSPEKVPAVPDAPSIAPDEAPPEEGKQELPDGCEEEIAEAVKACTKAQLNNWKGEYGTGVYKTPGVKPWGIPECVRISLAERCGGIPVQYTPWKKKKR